MPMMAKILSTHYGFDGTVLFNVNERGEVDPTMPVYPEQGKEAQFKDHHIPGLEHLASADLVIFFSRLLTLSNSELEHIVQYVDSGKPIIALRTANHGFLSELPYKIDGKQVRWGEDVLGGTFLNHHGRWMADSTCGKIAAYWGMGMESSITATRSVDIVGDYQPLGSGFDYEKLGVKPRPVSHYR